VIFNTTYGSGFNDDQRRDEELWAEQELQHAQQRERGLADDLMARAYEGQLPDDPVAESGPEPVGVFPFENGTGQTSPADLAPPDPSGILDEIRQSVDDVVAEAYLGVSPDWRAPRRTYGSKRYPISRNSFRYRRRSYR